MGAYSEVGGASEGDAVSLVALGTVLPVPPQASPALVPYADREVVLGLRPEEIHDRQSAPVGIDGAPVTATVDVAEMLGHEVLLHLLGGEQRFLARVPARTDVRPGQPIEMVLDMGQMHLFDPATELAIPLGTTGQGAAPG